MAAGDINVTIIGNLTNDPELRFTPSGAAVASFTVASSSRYLDKTSNEWKDIITNLPSGFKTAGACSKNSSITANS